MRVTNQNKTDAIKPTCSLKQNKGYKIKDKHKNEIEWKKTNLEDMETINKIQKILSWKNKNLSSFKIKFNFSN